MSSAAPDTSGPRAAGKIPGYETTVITRAELADDALKALHERIQGIITQYGGEMVMTEDWGKRKLAYPIGKETRGQYSYLVYTGKGDVVHEIERNLRIHDHVIRFLSVNLSKELDAEQFRKKRAEAHAAAKKREEEREARREERMAERRAYGGDDRRPRRDDSDEQPRRHSAREEDEE